MLKDGQKMSPVHVNTESRHDTNICLASILLHKVKQNWFETFQTQNFSLNNSIQVYKPQ